MEMMLEREDKEAERKRQKQRELEIKRQRQKWRKLITLEDLEEELFEQQEQMKEEEAAQILVQVVSQASVSPGAPKHALIIGSDDMEPRHIKNVLNAKNSLIDAGNYEIYMCLPGMPESWELDYFMDHGFISGRYDDTTIYRTSNTFSEIERSLIKMDLNMGKDDLVFIYVTGHGGLDEGDAYILLADGKMRGRWLADKVKERLDTKNKIIMADICYGGEFYREF
jgi:hypothetical protein